MRIQAEQETRNDPEGPGYVGLLRNALPKSIIDNLAAAIIAVGSSILATTYLAFKKISTPPLGRVPLWWIVGSVILCALGGAILEYIFFARLSIARLKRQVHELSIITKLDQLRELVEKIYIAVMEVDRNSSANSGLRRALSLAILAIDHYEEIWRKYDPGLQANF
jgi:hypothetical protein